MNQSQCHVARFEPRFCHHRRSRRSSALLITLIFVSLVTILVIAFLSLASQDLKSTYFYVRSDQADQIARAGLDFVVGNLQGEIEDATLSTNAGTVQSPFYVPTNGANVFPMRMFPIAAATTNILLISSSSVLYSTNFYTNTSGQGPSTMASTIPSTNSSINNQVISPGAWNKPMLIPANQAANMPIPNWVFIGRNGPVSVSSGLASSTYSPNLTNANAVIGRYAFVVYDTSGLLDINVAGYDSSQPGMATNAPGKGLLPYADLTQLPGINATDVNALVKFRNTVSETNFAAALADTNGYGLQSNGFMQVYATNGQSDSTFLSRQELIQYAQQTGNTDWTNALPYLTTFSREFNGPTWGPTTIAPSYNYQSNANTAATINPNIYLVKVQNAFTRNNGIPAVVGEPLVKYRFPLDKLALLQKMQGTGTLSASEIQQVQQYFGLDIASDVTATSGFYRHWVYPTTTSSVTRNGVVYSTKHGVLSGTTGIMTLNDVAAQNREPDFFELLQAGILNGSLAGIGRGDSGQAPEDFDSKTTPQILRIGANIINQWDTDNYPVTISYTGSPGFDVYGIADLPYITQMFTKAYSPGGSSTGPPSAATMPLYPYVYFQVWNPHQAPSTPVNNSPTHLRIVPYQNSGPPTGTNPAYSDYYDFWLIVTSGSYFYRYAYFQAPPGWSGSGNTYIGYFSSLPAASGGGSETASSAGLNFTINPQTDYREPGVVIGTPNPVGPWTETIPAGGGQPSGRLAAISLPAITSYPPAGKVSTSAQTGATPSSITWNTATMSSTWKLSFQSQTTFVLQFQDPSNPSLWHTYGTLIGMDSQSVSPFTGWSANQWVIPTSSSSTDDVSAAKPDPRTFRFGLGTVEQSQTGYAVTTPISPNSSKPPLLTPTSVAWVLWGGGSALPFSSTAAPSTPYRMDYWAANNKANPVQGPSSSLPAPYITDPDGVIRGADSAYAYSGNASPPWGSDPVLPGATYQTAALPARPVILHHPFNSVGDLGYAYRDDPFRTLDFMTPGSADAGLLDLFTLSEAPMLAGRINPNTPQAPVIAALVSGATQSSATGVTGATATVPSATAQAMGTNFVSFTSSPASLITNRASLVTSGAVSNIIYSGTGYLTDNGGSKSLVKTEAESVVRSLAESSNTRTWNLLIDVIGQSGHFINNSSPVSSGGKDNFVVDGERHYWLHVAIDRYTGKVVDQQLELVDQ